MLYLKAQALQAVAFFEHRSLSEGVSEGLAQGMKTKDPEQWKLTLCRAW